MADGSRDGTGRARGRHRGDRYGAGRRLEAATIEKSTNEAELALAEVFDRIAELVSLYRDDRNQSFDVVTVTSGVRGSNEWSELEERWAAAYLSLSQLAAEVHQAVSSATPDSDETRIDIIDAIEQLRERIGEMNSVISTHSDAVVSWIQETEAAQRTDWPALRPVERGGSAAAALDPEALDNPNRRHLGDQRRAGRGVHIPARTARRQRRSRREHLRLSVRLRAQRAGVRSH